VMSRATPDNFDVESQARHSNNRMTRANELFRHTLPLSHPEAWQCYSSTLRVFAGLINAKHMEDQQQDAVLHVVHLLTQFPPAVRAVHTLMNGKSLRPCEQAALTQGVCEVLRDIVPLPSVGHNIAIYHIITVYR
jgi:hypothetical protein